MSRSKSAVTRNLNHFNDEKNQESLDELGKRIYSELRKIAGFQLRKEFHNKSWQPTALANEAFLKIFKGTAPTFESRQHFYNISARVMRQILIDSARKRNTSKRKGVVLVTLDKADWLPHEGKEALGLLELDRALTKLAELDERLCKIVELRYFIGLDLEETAQVIGCSVGTVKRDWIKARAWLKKELFEED